MIQICKNKTKKKIFNEKIIYFEKKKLKGYYF